MAKDRIELLVETWEPLIRDAFLEAVSALRGSVSIKDLIALINARDIEGAIAAVGLDPARFRLLDQAVTRAFEAGGVDATLGIKPSRGPLGLMVTPMFDVRDPGAEQWIRQRTTDLIRQITEDQRDVIRTVLSPLSSGLNPMLTGDTPNKLALDLVGRVNRATGRREGGVLGLTKEQAQWARNYEISLGDDQSGALPDKSALGRKLRDKRFDKTIAKALREGAPIPADTRRTMVMAYRNRTLRHRAEGIASNEALSVLHQSQLEAWDQAIRRGAVTEDKVRKFWITAGDAKVRPEHAEIPGMNKGGVPLKSAFETPDGPRMYPPIDPGCRCRVRMRIVEPSA